jgi:hypothetical protein
MYTSPPHNSLYTRRYVGEVVLTSMVADRLRASDGQLYFLKLNKESVIDAGKPSRVLTTCVLPLFVFWLQWISGVT